MSDTADSQPRRERWRYAAAGLFAIGAASTVAQFGAAAAFGTLDQMVTTRSTGGVVALVAAAYLGLKSTSWADFARRLSVWVAITVAIAVTLVGVQAKDVKKDTEAVPRQATSKASDVAPSPTAQPKDRSGTDMMFKIGFRQQYETRFGEKPGARLLGWAYDMGLVVCEARDAGKSFDEIYSALGEGLTAEKDVWIHNLMVFESMVFICDEHRADFEAWVGSRP